MLAALKHLATTAFILLALAGCGGGGGGNDGGAILPTPQADAFTWAGNTRLNVSAAAGLLANDPSGTVIAAADSVSAQGGTVTVDLATGGFTYHPPVGAQNLDDTFTYTVDGSPVQVTVSLVERIWYVRNNAPGAGLGNDQAPFLTLAEAEAASDEDDTLFVFAGDQTAAGQDRGITLKNGQKLLGEGVGLRVNGVPIVDPIPEALISNAALAPAGSTPVVLLAANNEVAGFILHAAFNEALLAVGGTGHSLRDNIITFDPAGGREGIRLLSVGGENVVTRNTITGAPGAAIRIADHEDRDRNAVPPTPMTATLTVSRNSISRPARDGILASLDGTGTEVTLQILTNTLSSSGAGGNDQGIDIQASGAARVTAVLSRNTIAGSSAEAMHLGAAGASVLNAFVANGALSASGGAFDFAGVSGSTGDFCLELVNNGNTGGTASFGVENSSGIDGAFRLFEDLNDAPAVRTGTISTIADGGCGIVLAGAPLFEANCGQCHRGNGLGRGSVGPDITGATAAMITFQLADNLTMSGIDLTRQEIQAIAAALATQRPGE